ncbi:unnamed protein product [Victoria cruziana]
MHPSLPLLLLFIFLCSPLFSYGIELTLVNNCKESIWPAIMGGAGHHTPQYGGLHLGHGREFVVNVPQGWSGRLWPRRGCQFNEQGHGECETGDCMGLLHCRGAGGLPPMTVVEMTLGTSKSPLHFYDVSLVNGFNLPVSIVPVGGGIGCGMASCESDLNLCCPASLEVKKEGRVVACKSACMALNHEKYCCTGNYSTPHTCKPTIFSNVFKVICPRAYSYPYDDSSSLHKCMASKYLVTFCPPSPY